MEQTTISYLERRYTALESAIADALRQTRSFNIGNAASGGSLWAAFIQYMFPGRGFRRVASDTRTARSPLMTYYSSAAFYGFVVFGGDTAQNKRAAPKGRLSIINQHLTWLRG